MTVSVHVPTRIRVDAATLEGPREELLEAVATASRRALSNSVDVALAPRGGDLGVDAADPTFRWTGVAVDPGLREQVERDIAASLARAVEDAGVRELERAAPAAGELPPPGAYEAGAGTEVQQVSFEPEPVTITGRPAAQQWRHLSLVALAYQKELVEALVAEAVAQWGPVSEGVARMGLMWRIGDLWWVLMRPPEGGDAQAFSMGNFHMWELRGHARDAEWELVPVEPPPARVRARIQLIGTPQERAAAVRDLYASEIEAEVEEVARSSGVGAERLPAIVAEQREAELERRAADLPSEARGLVIFEIGGHEIVAPATAQWLKEFGWKGDAELLPVTAPAPPAEDVEGEESPDGEAGTAECPRYLDEPSLDELGAPGRRLRDRMAALGEKLGLPACQWAGGFALAAAAALRQTALQAADEAVMGDGEPAGRTRATPEGDGNIQLVEFEPLDSTAILEFQRLVVLLRPLRELGDEISAAYRVHYTARGAAPAYVKWLLGFSEELHARLHRGAGHLFMSTCRVLMMQLLNASRNEIEARKAPAYAELFKRLILPRLEDVDTLLRLVEHLDDYVAHELPYESSQSMYGAEYRVSVADWSARAMHKELVQLLTPPQAAAPDAPQPTELRRTIAGFAGGKIVTRGYAVAIEDAQGREWTKQQLLETARKARGVAESADPFVKQFIDIPGVVAGFRAAKDVETELNRRLDEMLALNAGERSKVRHDPPYAFRFGRITKAKGGGYAMSGLHQKAHDKLAEAAAGEQAYRLGVKYLFDAGMGRQDLIAFGEFTGITLISVVCPPLGFLAGVATAVYHYEEASERRETYGALINPEEVISWAEVETEMFAAKLGLVLSFIPVLPVLGRAGRAAMAGREVARDVMQAGAKTAVTQEAKAELGRVARKVGVRTFAGAFGKATVEQLTEELSRGLVAGFVKELVEDKVMETLLSPVLQTWMEAVQEEAIRNGPVGGAIEGAAE